MTIIDLAHEGHLGLHTESWTIAVVLGAVAALLAAGAVTGSLSARAIANGPPKPRRAQRKAEAVRVGQMRTAAWAAAVLSIAAAGASWATAPRGDDPPVVSTTTPIDLPPSPGPDKDLPLSFVAATEEGNFEAAVTNNLGRDAWLQCSIEARDEQGGLVFTHTYTAFDEDGERFEADVYTTQFPLAAASEQRFSADLRIEEPMASIEGSCMEIPPPPGADG